MSQKQVYELLQELGGKATIGQLSILAKQKYPEKMLHSNITEFVSQLEDQGIVKKGKLGFYGLTGRPLPERKDPPVVVETHDRYFDENDEQVKETWSAYFFKHEGIKPVILELDDLDVQSEFLANLKASLRGGYDNAMPLRVAVNIDRQDIDGQLIDGLHRSYCLDLIYKHEGLEITPTIERVFVKDLDDLRAKKLYYEFLNQSKSLYVSTRKAERSFNQTMKIHPELDTLEKVLNFFTARGFTNKGALEGLWKRYAAVQKSRKERTERIKEIITKQESAWPQPQTPENFRTEDATTTQRLKCPCCDEEYFAFIKGDRVIKSEKIKEEKIA